VVSFRRRQILLGLGKQLIAVVKRRFQTQPAFQSFVGAHQEALHIQRRMTGEYVLGLRENVSRKVGETMRSETSR